MATISGLSSLDPTQSSPSTDPRNTIKQLFAAVQAGDLGAAQKAYDALTQNSPLKPLHSSTIGQDFSAIGDALKAGDVKAAQQALAQLQDDLQAAGRAHKHHHHHHHGAKGAASSTDASQAPATVDPNDPTSLVGTTLNVKA